MTVIDQIRELPLRDKLLAMEALWDDISKAESVLEVPQWHKTILDERERLIAEGKAGYLDWEEAKRQIIEATG